MQLLKIAANHYPGIRIVATGSSTLGGSSRFHYTLAGRKAGTSSWRTMCNALASKVSMAARSTSSASAT
jgi:hypothetical protein